MIHDMNGDIFQDQARARVGIQTKSTRDKIKLDTTGAAAIIHSLEIMDRQQHIRRFEWKNLPKGLTAEMIERVLYYRGQAMFFCIKGKYYMLPYTLHTDNNTSIDVNGQYVKVHPLPFTGISEVLESGDSNTEKAQKQATKSLGIYLATQVREVVYDLESEDGTGQSETNTDNVGEDGSNTSGESGDLQGDGSEGPKNESDSSGSEDGSQEPNSADLFQAGEIGNCNEDKCVLLWDYIKGISQTITPRASHKDWILSYMKEDLIMGRVAGFAGIPVKFVRMADQGMYDSVKAELDTIDQEVLRGKRFIPVVGALPMDDINSESPTDSQAYSMQFESHNNLRLSQLGIKSGGTHNKNQHILQAEQDAQDTGTDIIKTDSLLCRQLFANLANQTFGTNIEVDLCESMADTDPLGMEGADINGSGVQYKGNKAPREITYNAGE